MKLIKPVFCIPCRAIEIRFDQQVEFRHQTLNGESPALNKTISRFNGRFDVTLNQRSTKRGTLQYITKKSFLLKIINAMTKCVSHNKRTINNHNDAITY